VPVKGPSANREAGYRGRPEVESPGVRRTQLLTSDQKFELVAGQTWRTQAMMLGDSKPSVML
jgi:hypothetical protein